MARQPKSIDEQISEAYERENAAIRAGNRAASMQARIERRTLRKAKKDLVEREDLPSTPDPVRPPKPDRPKPDGLRQVERRSLV